MSNHKFKTTNIRGKQYVEVNERIKFFRTEEQYKYWTISTEVNMLEGKDECISKCVIADTEQRVIATGHAHEVKSASNINKTSYVENCETSAVGRALAMMGIGIDTSIASANEVNEAIAKQNSPKAGQSPEKPKAVDDKGDFQKAVDFLKEATDKIDAWSKIEKQSKTKFTDEQYDRLVEYSKA
jgi:hypothetical protein|tara:strand:+ start:1772 stop:2323 length:552 start_codon:yes stop_codon:yes gene_type:complete